MANIEAEVISAVCTNGDISSLMQSDIDDLFVSHADVWDGLKKYYYKYHAVPSVDILKEKYRNFDSEPVKGETQFYVDKLREDYVAMEIRNLLLNAGNALKTDSSIRVLERMQTKIGQIGKLTNVVKDIDITDYELAEKHFDSVRRMSEERGGTPGIKTGIAAIDAVYPTGFAGGHLVYMLGYTGKKKTWMALYLACKAFEQGFSPMVFSLEMSPEDVRDRVYGLLGSGLFRVSELQRGYVNIDDFKTWGKKNLDGRPRFNIISSEGQGDVTPNVILGKIDQYQPDIVFVDYLQLMTDNGKSRGMTERYTNATHELKQLAMRVNKPIVAISAVTDSENDSQDSPPRLAQVAWSKALAYDTDLSLSVHGHTGTDIVEVFLEKNRRGAQSTFFMKTDLDRGIIEEHYEELE